MDYIYAISMCLIIRICYLSMLFLFSHLYRHTYARALLLL